MKAVISFCKSADLQSIRSILFTPLHFSLYIKVKTLRRDWLTFLTRHTRLLYYKERWLSTFFCSFLTDWVMILLWKLFKVNATHRCIYSERSYCCSYFEKSCRLGMVGHCRIGRSLLRSAWLPHLAGSQPCQGLGALAMLAALTWMAPLPDTASADLPLAFLSFFLSNSVGLLG